MKVEEIEIEIRSNNNKLSDLKSQVYKLESRNRNLNYTKEKLLVNNFVEYLKVGDTFEIKDYFNPSSVQLDNFSSGPRRTMSSTFYNGDVLKIEKKNKVTFIVSVSFGSSGLSRPDTKFRINVIDLYRYLSHKSEYKKLFLSFLNRNESLKSLGI